MPSDSQPKYHIDVNLSIIGILCEKILLIELQLDDESLEKWNQYLTITKNIYSLESQWIMSSKIKRWMVISDGKVTYRTSPPHNFNSTYKLIDQVRAMRQITDLDQYAEELDKFDLTAYESLLTSEIAIMRDSGRAV